MPEPPASCASPVTVLIVEHPDVSKFLRHYLENYSGFTVIEAATVAQATLLLRTPGVRIDLLITNKPQELYGLRDGLKLLYTASIPDERFIRLVGARNFAVLRKPFHTDQLLAKLCWLLAAPELAAALRARLSYGKEASESGH